MTNMHKRHDDPPAPSQPTLLKRAEIQPRRAGPENVENLSLAAMQRMMHDLHSHQIELEMQNEELRRTQLELASERTRYFALYDLAPVGYCTVSEAGLILQANLMLAQLLGLPRGALVQQPFSSFIFKADQDTYYLCRRTLIESGQPGACELRLVKPDGVHFWVNLSATFARDELGAPTLRIALTDVSEIKRVMMAVTESEARYQTLNEQLQAKNVELETTQAAAHKANRAKSDFLSNMSHELRTPLSAILGFTQLLEAGTPPPTESQQLKLKQVLKAGWYLLDLINEILDLAQVESGTLPMTMDKVALGQVVNECKAMVEPHAQTRGISVTCSPHDVSYMVHADVTRLKQALLNLLSNAIKYNKTGGTVVVDCTEPAPGKRVRINVTDTGAGLTPEKLAQLFQPFNRLGQEESDVQGTGIGLVMCKRLVNLMGGNIGVKSTVGTGSCFWIELNIATTAQPDTQDTQDTQDTESLADSIPQINTLHIGSVLYIEDNPANLLLVEHLIARRSDLHLLSASNGPSGFEVARASQPDVILMDINLPGISGITTMAMLVDDPQTAHIPVVALTANAMPEDIEAARAAGFFNYLIKPIRVGELMDALDAALKFSQTTLSRQLN